MNNKISLFKKVFYLILFLNLTVSYSQNEDNNWYFGGDFGNQTDPIAGLDFNTIVGSVPTPLTNSLLGYTEGAATMSDSNEIYYFIQTELLFIIDVIH